MPMTPRVLGRTGIRVSPLGLAALAIPSSGGVRGLKLGPDDVERAFYDHGVTTFLVHFLMKEMCEGVRRLIRDGHREELVLVSEVSTPFAGSIRRGLEKHLRLLGTDHLDVWLYGWMKYRWQVRDSVWSEMQREKAAGQVRALGYSTHDRAMAARMAVELPADVLMIRYNAAHRGAEREVFAPLEKLGAQRPGIISYTCTRWGMLLQPAPGFEQPMTAVECYRFALGHPMVDMAWCAARTLDELRQDVAGIADGPLPPPRLSDVRRFGDAVHAAAKGGRRWMFGASAQ